MERDVFDHRIEGRCAHVFQLRLFFKRGFDIAVRGPHRVIQSCADEVNFTGAFNIIGLETLIEFQSALTF